MANSKQVDDALNRLAAAEERFLASEFLAPVFLGSQVQVRIAGVICRLKVKPADFDGWGVFRPNSHSEARLVRAARLAERQRYLDLFPLVRLIFCGRHGNDWLALPAHRADTRFQIEGLVTVRFVEDPQLFELVQTRFDGSQFWYGGSDPRWDPSGSTRGPAECTRSHGAQPWRYSEQSDRGPEVGPLAHCRCMSAGVPCPVSAHDCTRRGLTMATEGRSREGRDVARK